MKKIIIFGATGQTGVYTVDYLKDVLDDDYEIIAVGHRKTNYFKRYNIKYFSVDISESEDFKCLPTEEVFAVVNLAAILPAKMPGYKPELYYKINTIGMINIMEYCAKVKADRIVYTKSVADLYGYRKNGKEIDVLLPDLPPKYQYGTDHTIYALSKESACEIIKNYQMSFGIKAFILRLPNIYCYHPEKEYYVNGKLVPVSYRYMIDRAIAGKQIEIWGDPEKGRDFAYVKDFAQLIYRTIVTEVNGGVYNMGSGTVTSMKKQIEGIIQVFCDKENVSEIIYKPEKRDCVNYLMDITKTREELNYNPQYGYIDYLKDYKKEMNMERFNGL